MVLWGALHEKTPRNIGCFQIGIDFLGKWFLYESNFRNALERGILQGVDQKKEKDHFDTTKNYKQLQHKTLYFHPKSNIMQ